MVVVRTGGEGGRREGSRQRGEEKREEEEREERGGSRGEDEGEERGGERQEGTKPREASGRRSSQCAVRGCLSLDGGDRCRSARTFQLGRRLRGAGPRHALAGRAGGAGAGADLSHRKVCADTRVTSLQLQQGFSAGVAAVRPWRRLAGGAGHQGREQHVAVQLVHVGPDRLPGVDLPESTFGPTLWRPTTPERELAGAGGGE